MSEKRFEVVLNEFDEVEYIMDKEMMEDRDFAEFMSFVEILAKKNEELKAKASSWKITCSQEMNEKEDLIKQLIELKRENEQLKIVNAKWLDKSLQDKQIRYNNANHKELTQKYLQLKNENEQLRQKISSYEKLIMSSYEGEEENLDGEFVGRYVIWEDELERWREKYG